MRNQPRKALSVPQINTLLESLQEIEYHFEIAGFESYGQPDSNGSENKPEASEDVGEEFVPKVFEAEEIEIAIDAFISQLSIDGVIKKPALSKAPSIVEVFEELFGSSPEVVHLAREFRTYPLESSRFLAENFQRRALRSISTGLWTHFGMGSNLSKSESCLVPATPGRDGGMLRSCRRSDEMHCPSGVLIAEDGNSGCSTAIQCTQMLLPILGVLFRIGISDSASNLDWKSKLPEVRSVLDKQFGEDTVEGPYPVAIFRSADITGDGIPEVLVSFGTPGASTTQITLLRMESSTPVAVLFKDQKRRIEPMIFYEGSSVMHSDAVRLLQNEHALFHFHFERTARGRLGPCDGEAYHWHAPTKTLDYDPVLSKKLTRESCSAVPQSIQ